MNKKSIHVKILKYYSKNIKQWGQGQLVWE